MCVSSSSGLWLGRGLRERESRNMQGLLRPRLKTDTVSLLNSTGQSGSLSRPE